MSDFSLWRHAQNSSCLIPSVYLSSCPWFGSPVNDIFSGWLLRRFYVGGHSHERQVEIQGVKISIDDQVPIGNLLSKTDFEQPITVLYG